MPLCRHSLCLRWCRSVLFGRDDLGDPDPVLVVDLDAPTAGDHDFVVGDDVDGGLGRWRGVAPGPRAWRSQDGCIQTGTGLCLPVAGPVFGALLNSKY